MTKSEVTHRILHKQKFICNKSAVTLWSSSSGTPQFKAIFSLRHLHPDGMPDMRGTVCK